MILSTYFFYVHILGIFEPDWKCYPRFVYGSHYEAKVDNIGWYTALILKEKIDSVKIPIRIPHYFSEYLSNN